MAMQDETLCNIKVSSGGQDDISSIFDSTANVNRPPSPNVKIHKVPRKMERNEHEHNKYYAPKVVSIGPYHFGDPKLEFVENLKPVFANKLLSNNKEALKTLWGRLSEPKMVQELRDYYEENSTSRFYDKVFTRIMLLDACFILYYIKFLSSGKHKDYCLELKSHQIVFVHQDLLLLENQIPLKVIKEVMNVIIPNGYQDTKPFIDDNILTSMPKRRWYESLFWCRKDQRSSDEESKEDFMKAINECDHLLHLLHHNLTKNGKTAYEMNQTVYRCTFRNVSELVDVGIYFKPSGAKSFARIDFRQSWWYFSAKIELPPIRVDDDSTKPMLLNLIAYEMSSNNAHDSWVTSYICLLHYLINKPEDVTTLRRALVLENYLGSDQEVAEMFDEIGTDLVPNSIAYMEVKNRVQQHYEMWRNTLFSQFKHEYINNPWALMALFGAVLSIGLNVVQTYFTIWSPQSQCDDLCMLLKMNHHL